MTFLRVRESCRNRAWLGTSPAIVSCRFSSVISCLLSCVTSLAGLNRFRRNAQFVPMLTAAEWKRFYQTEREQLGQTGLLDLFDRAPKIELSKSGAIVFPHTRLSA